MKNILLALIALSVLSLGLAGSGLAKTSFFASETEVPTTTSISEFLNDSWKPVPFLAPIYYATWPDKNRTLQNTSDEIYKLLNDSYKPSGFEAPLLQAVWPGKDGTLATTGYAIHDFMRDDWTPADAVPMVTRGDYKLRQMN
ncbi:MAG: hypothetical protein A4E47_01006 [Methanosaeta sp. PtaU1.Bin028]|nr:MAG: hypothetical protein A4E47_01006 [Methanosaeta sp. PtaU1.Bin028]